MARTAFPFAFTAENGMPEQEEELAILISNQPTHQELLDTGTEIGLDTVLDFTIKQVGNMTKTYQKELITNQENKLRELSNDLTSARNSGNVDLIIKKDEELGTLLNQVCRQEAEKMAVFRLINDEKPTRAMINLEKKIGGYYNHLQEKERTTSTSFPHPSPTRNSDNMFNNNNLKMRKEKK